MNRRIFVTSLGGPALLPAVSAAQTAAPRSSRARVELNGSWERSVDGKLVDLVEVPSSLRPSGFYKLTRQFQLMRLAANERAILCFDSIALHGSASVNGVALGELDPYVPYEFDITPHAREGANAVQTSIADLTPGPDGAGRDAIEIGINPGWEAYGGIIRDVWVEVRPAVYIGNVRLAYTLDAGYRRARCEPRVFLSSSIGGEARLEAGLYSGPHRVAEASAKANLTVGVNPVDLEFEVAAPALWSPDRSNLYELRVSVESAAGRDTWSQRTGFRHFAIRGRALELNGERLILNGVNRHDMWKDQGFTMSRAQMEKDMRMIKALGANYVRLVHYPHDRYVVELADEIGLTVSGEPGYWQVDFGSIPRSRVELGLRIMERMIRRDWNSPSVLFWILGNESRLTTEYLREGRELCKRLDPIDRPVSFANSMDPKAAKPIMEAAGLDIFTQHPYTYDLEYFDRTAAIYGPEKPLVFTEWGGKAIGQTEIIMERTVNKLLDLQERGELAGHAFWSWQDVPEFSRIDPEMRDGILESGVVTEAREPRRLVHSELARLFQGRRKDSAQPPAEPEAAPLRRAPWDANSRFEPVELESVIASKIARAGWEGFTTALAAGKEKIRLPFRFWRCGEMNIGGALFRFPLVEGEARPVILGAGTPEVSIPIRRKCRRLHVLGHVTIPGGFPVSGKPGEVVAVYRVVFSGGATKEIPLRNGYEVAQANTIHGATRINPIATEAQRALWFRRDLAREQYQFLLYPVETGGRMVESITCSHRSGQQPLLLFAITAEMA